jgi:predicted transcriptional regulator
LNSKHAQIKPIKPLIAILKALEKCGKAKEIDLIKNLPQFSTSTIHSNLEKAVFLGLVEKVDQHYYTLTEKGKEFLKTAIEEIKRFVEVI